MLRYKIVVKDVKPRKGEKEDEFISRFMSGTKNEYPDQKQRLAVAYSYWRAAHDAEKPIVIYETHHCDTRALPEGETLDKDEVKHDTELHIDAVKKCCDFICDKIKEQAAHHDHTKLEHLDKYLDDLNSRETDTAFKKRPWWKIHMQERHHLNDRVPDDVNLIDVIEMVCDCVSAGMARTGEVFTVELDPNVLEKAFKNTMQLLQDNIEVKK